MVDFNSLPKYVTINEFCDQVRLSESTVRRRINAGDIPSLQPGGHRTRILIPVSYLASTEQKSNIDVTEDDSDSRPVTKPIPGPRPRWMATQEDIRTSLKDSNHHGVI